MSSNGTDILVKGLNFSVTSKTLQNKYNIATIEDEVEDCEREQPDTIRTKTSLKFQNFKPSQDTLSKNKHKTLKELQSYRLIVILPVDKKQN